MTETQPAIGVDAQYLRHLTEGRFMIQRGKITGAAVFYPRPFAPITGEELQWVEASGKGTVYSSVTVRKRPPEPSFNIALIDLAEGPRMMSRVEGIDPADVRIGMAVCARIIMEEDLPLVVFTPDEDGR